MTSQVILRAPPVLSVDRRQPLLKGQDTYSQGGGRVRNKANWSEVAGGTAAECTAVCCCCPCGIANLLVLAVYKVPAGLCRKALRKKRRRRIMKKKGLLTQCSCSEDEFHMIHPISSVMDGIGFGVGVEADDTDVVALEKEMWDKFYGTGFWRSPSQRSDVLSDL